VSKKTLKRRWKAAKENGKQSRNKIVVSNNSDSETEVNYVVYQNMLDLLLLHATARNVSEFVPKTLLVLKLRRFQSDLLRIT
jgi:hypothetical protein